ncbi:CMRF35-like molecule 7 [Suricata suricatta]|uniref:Immunoglobulin V-set domain-containing protein n=1 Tax=Suricata suricatta TaxID=37032 RepID=A0A673VG70_SURSU|nr:CMRF35-like molecule 7 [Suricata suricatta]
MWLLPVLFLLMVQGHFSTQGERTVKGIEGGTLTTSCEYGPGWESYRKWWCRGKNWNSCRILVKTTGSEKLVKKGRASIQDNRSQRKFNVTLEDLRRDDADIYWCGIERTGNDLGYKVSVVVDPAPDPTDSSKPVITATLPSWISTLPFTQTINSSQPVNLTNPLTRSETLAFNVAAENPPVWILLVPPLLVTLEWLCRG